MFFKLYSSASEFIGPGKCEYFLEGGSFMLGFLNKFFLTGPDAPPIQDAEKAKSIFNSVH